MGDVYAISGRCIDKVMARKGTPKSVVFSEKGLKQTKERLTNLDYSFLSSLLSSTVILSK